MAASGMGIGAAWEGHLVAQLGPLVAAALLLLQGPRKRRLDRRTNIALSKKVRAAHFGLPVDTP